ncbi:MAG: EAL domain-containing protein [Micromonosporaceae bacterium]|nr:EAL domain-containing protein [Micromonosporaceae bacterium]
MTDQDVSSGIGQGSDPLAETLAGTLARAIAEAGFALMSLAEIEDLTRGWVPELLHVLEREGADLEPARRIGMALVDANMTNPGVLETALEVLLDHLPAGRWSSTVRAAVAAGYAAGLRRATLAEQEQIAGAIIIAYARVDRMARESEARFRALFDGSAVGIGISDRTGRVVQVNQALATLLGYTVDEMCGFWVPEMTHPSDPPEIWDQYRRMMLGEIDHVRMEKAYYRKDNAVVWVDLTVSLIRDDQGNPQFAVAIMDDMTDRHHLQATLSHQALHDPLTGLPNRSLFAERIAQVVATAGPQSRMGVCYLDLDGFKRINDTLGHDTGDQLLITIADRLGRCAEDRGHLVARMGGDEFVLLVERSAGMGQLAALAEAALAVVAVPISVGPHRLRVTASIGVVECPAMGADLGDILKAADVTLYRAKAAGRGRWLAYDPGTVAELVAGYELCAALPDALERGEFSLVYQPIVGLSDGRPWGLEALVRWHHPSLGLLTPDRFIGPAEETGFIVQLGQHVLREACREAAAWRERFAGGELFVSVNLAVAQAHEPSLVDEIKRTLVETGLDPSQLQLELTESALMSTAGAPLEALRALADLGVRVAIDDFGTGYSNLAYLRSLPVHALKLPQQLVGGLRGPADRSKIDERIVDALIRLAHAIELTVTAEGVETQAQAEQLSALGCDSVQGWHIAKPCSADQLDRVISRLGRAPHLPGPRAEPKSS